MQNISIAREGKREPEETRKKGKKDYKSSFFLQPLVYLL